MKKHQVSPRSCQVTEVYPSEPYRCGAMGSLGDASCMLLRQFNFPNTYTRNLDKHSMADHDRCMSWDPEHTRRCFKQHTGTGELGLEDWLRRATDENVLVFLRDILKAEPGVTWTGYRIMGTVHRGNGYPVWTLELFAKHPDTDTEVYTGSNAPNVLSHVRYGG